MVAAAGDATLIPQKTRAVFMTRMRFINIQVRRASLIVGFVLRERPSDARFFKVETFSPRTHVAYVRLATMEQLDAGLRRWIRQAYKAGASEP
jgi:hypothetical protein